MKKNTINAFTLVEMLIVIVIIGILIAALMPRMQAAQGRARDVSRKTALSQIQSAIVTSQGDNGEWPAQEAAKNGTGVSAISGALLRAGMNSIPVDPLKSEEVEGLGGFSGNTIGDYAYMVATRNGSDAGGFILMAKTEVEGGSNWVVCPNKDGLSGGRIKSTTDIVNIQTCTSFAKDDNGLGCGIDNGKCTYYADDQLRYIVLY